MWTSCPKTQCLSKLSLLDSLLQEVCIKIICSDIFFICLLLGLIPKIGSLRIKENHLSKRNFIAIKEIPKHVQFAEYRLLVPKTQSLSIMTKLCLLDSLLQEVCIKIICSVFFICLLLGLIPKVGSLRIKLNYLSKHDYRVH